MMVKISADIVQSSKNSRLRRKGMKLALAWDDEVDKLSDSLSAMALQIVEHGDRTHVAVNIDDD